MPYRPTCLLVPIEETYLPADSKYIDNGKLDGSENDSAAYNITKTTTQSTFRTLNILQQHSHTQWPLLLESLAVTGMKFFSMVTVIHNTNYWTQSFSSKDSSGREYYFIFLVEGIYVSISFLLVASISCENR